MYDLEKKTIIRGSRIVVVIFILVVMIFFVEKTDEVKLIIGKLYRLINFNNGNSIDSNTMKIALWQGQVTIAVLVVSIATLIINNIDDRILGNKVKKLLLKDEIWILNYQETVLSIFILVGISSLWMLIGSIYMTIIFFYINMMLIGWISYLTYIVTIKRSRIYSKIEKELIDKKNEKFYDELIKKAILQYNSIVINNYSYIVEEVILLKKLSEHCKNNKKYSEKMLLENLIVEKVEKYIENSLPDKEIEKKIKEDHEAKIRKNLEAKIKNSSIIDLLHRNTKKQGK